MAGNLVVAAYRDGRRVRGRTMDFFPSRPEFHVLEQYGASHKVRLDELKAVFFVRDLHGNPLHERSNRFEPGRPVAGRKIRVLFDDGELLVGTTQGYEPKRPAFFVSPADPRTNSERCFVVAAATREVRLL
jgi:hypothetical protein